MIAMRWKIATFHSLFYGRLSFDLVESELVVVPALLILTLNKSSPNLCNYWRLALTALGILIKIVKSSGIIAHDWMSLDVNYNYPSIFQSQNTHEKSWNFSWMKINPVKGSAKLRRKKKPKWIAVDRKRWKFIVMTTLTQASTHSKQHRINRIIKTVGNITTTTTATTITTNPHPPPPHQHPSTIRTLRSHHRMDRNPTRSTKTAVTTWMVAVGGTAMAQATTINFTTNSPIKSLTITTTTNAMETISSGKTHNKISSKCHQLLTTISY